MTWARLMRRMRLGLIQPSRRVAVRVSDEGLTLVRSGHPGRTLLWKEVVRIAVARDSAAFGERVVLEFTDAIGGRWEVDDEMRDFRRLAEDLRRHFPSVPADWWEKIAFQGLADGALVLYERPPTVRLRPVDRGPPA